MKFKTTAIAMAVAGTVAAPVAVQAGADEVYASARVGVWHVDNDASDTADVAVQNFSSRFGMRGETDLGNGLSGFGRYEFSVTDDGVGLRHRYVGLKGGWGSILLGQTNHTFYNYVVGPLDNPWWHSGYTMIDYRSRDDHGITYSGGTGAVSFGVTTFHQTDAEETFFDAIEAGLSFGLGDSTLGIGYATVDEDGGFTGSGGAGGQGKAWASDRTDDIIGVTWSGIGIGDTSLGVNVTVHGDDTGVVLDWLIGNFYVHYELTQYDDLFGTTGVSSDQSTITVGYTQSLGRKTTMYYEAAVIDSDGVDDPALIQDSTRVMAVLKYDII